MVDRETRRFEHRHRLLRFDRLVLRDRVPFVHRHSFGRVQARVFAFAFVLELFVELTHDVSLLVDVELRLDQVVHAELEFNGLLFFFVLQSLTYSGKRMKCVGVATNNSTVVHEITEGCSIITSILKLNLLDSMKFIIYWTYT